MPVHSRGFFLPFAAVLFMCLSLPATGQVIDLNSIKPACPAPYPQNPIGGKCVGNDALLTSFTQTTCPAVPGVVYEGGKCIFKADAAPLPSCGNLIPDLEYKDGNCVVDRSVPRSSKGDYEGDYFHLIAISSAHSRITYPQGTWLKVLSQQKLGDNDMELTVIPVNSSPTPFFEWRDKEKKEQARTVRATDLAEVGATRAGWAYGGLALPFKYYSGDHRFATNVSIGPYVGWRWGQPGSTTTVAITAAIGSVAGEVRDANNNITSTPQLVAFSMGGGVMWDLSKAPDAKPFKIGVFLGQDRVSRDDVVKFKDDGKWWASLQVGFDFTDN